MLQIDFDQDEVVTSESSANSSGYTSNGNTVKISCLQAFKSIWRIWVACIWRMLHVLESIWAKYQWCSNYFKCISFFFLIFSSHHWLFTPNKIIRNFANTYNCHYTFQKTLILRIDWYLRLHNWKIPFFSNLNVRNFKFCIFSG